MLEVSLRWSMLALDYLEEEDLIDCAESLAIEMQAERGKLPRYKY